MVPRILNVWLDCDLWPTFEQLGNKNTIGGRKLNITIQEREYYDIKLIEIITFVVKENIESLSRTWVKRCCYLKETSETSGNIMQTKKCFDIHVPRAVQERMSLISHDSCTKSNSSFMSEYLLDMQNFESLWPVDDIL